jgi:hypothetical protein
MKIKYPDDMHVGKEGHPQCSFFEAFASSSDPDCDFYGEFFCHMEEKQAPALVCKGDYLLCPIAYGKKNISLEFMGEITKKITNNPIIWIGYYPNHCVLLRANWIMMVPEPDPYFLAVIPAEWEKNSDKFIGEFISKANAYIEKISNLEK